MFYGLPPITRFLCEVRGNLHNKSQSTENIKIDKWKFVYEK